LNGREEALPIATPVGNEGRGLAALPEYVDGDISDHTMGRTDGNRYWQYLRQCRFFSDVAPTVLAASIDGRGSGSTGDYRSDREGAEATLDAVTRFSEGHAVSADLTDATEIEAMFFVPSRREAGFPPRLAT
jgi:hypothetical protein